MTTNSLSPERRAYVKEKENIYRLETWCALRGVTCTNQMREEVKAGCRKWYVDHESLFIPSAALLSFAGIAKEPQEDQTLAVGANSPQLEDISAPLPVIN